MVLPPERNPNKPAPGHEHLFANIDPETGNLKVVPLPTHSIKDVAGGLRRLADDIDAGKYADAYNVVWIVDCGSARVEFGMLGNAAEPSAVMLLLMEMAKNKLITETAAQGAPR